FIGLLADKISLRYFVIFTPAITGTLMSSLGLAPSYLALIFILIATGISVASFHAPAPAMVAEISGSRIGTGMGIFMAGGELGRTIGPLVLAYGIEWFGLAGIWRLAVIGWIVSAVLFFRLRKIPASTKPKGFLPWAKAKRIFPVLAILVIGRTFMRGAISTFLPTYLVDIFGTSEKYAAFSFSILQAAGVIGVLLVGHFSDRIGRKSLLFFLLTASPIILFLLTISPEQFVIPLLVLLGFSALSVMPILLAIVQEQFSDNRALANGSFLALNFVSSAVGIWLLGGIAQLLGLKTSFIIAAIAALITLPAILYLPSKD
ncbi:MAG TPA: MFS transporter, partial [Trueperaceae bacterium]|nr:MFS transporter [Trueperaceae bacterium]